MTKFKIGEKVKCIPESRFKQKKIGRRTGGMGYNSAKERDFVTINKISDYPGTTHGDCYFFEEIADGVYEFALEAISQSATVETTEDNSECIEDLINIFK